MRLAVFTSKYPARVATFFERDMRALLEAGVELEIFAIYPRDDRLQRYGLDLLSPDVLSPDRVHHLTLPASLRAAPRGMRPDWTTALRDAAAIGVDAVRRGMMPLAKSLYVLPKAWAWAAEHAQRFDHVLAYWGNYAGTCAYAFHRLAPHPIPFSLWLHAGTDLYCWPVFLRPKLVYADRIITCCAFNRTYLLEQFPDLADQINEKILVCYHGLDLAAFPFRAAVEERPSNRIIAVGRLARDKGFAYLLWAVHELAARGNRVELELVGDGPERGALSQLAQQLGIAQQIRWRGWVPFAQVREAMLDATILVHPSEGLGDGLPNVLREAMALGTPVIASRVAGIPEALNEGQCGVLVPPRDVPALADAIAALLADPDRRRLFADRGRAWTEAQFDTWRNGARLAEALRATARGQHSPARSPSVSEPAVEIPTW